MAVVPMTVRSPLLVIRPDPMARYISAYTSATGRAQSGLDHGLHLAGLRNIDNLEAFSEGRPKSVGELARRLHGAHQIDGFAPFRRR
jgi:hypothetical protein